MIFRAEDPATWGALLTQKRVTGLVPILIFLSSRQFAWHASYIAPRPNTPIIAFICLYITTLKAREEGRSALEEEKSKPTIVDFKEAQGKFRKWPKGEITSTDRDRMAQWETLLEISRVHDDFIEFQRRGGQDERPKLCNETTHKHREISGCSCDSLRKAVVTSSKIT